MRMKVTKLMEIYYGKMSVIILNPLYQNDTKRNRWVVLYTHITQLMGQTTSVYIAATYFAIMLLSLFGRLQRVINSQKVCISFGNSGSQYSFSQKRLRLNFQTCF